MIDDQIIKKIKRMHIVGLYLGLITIFGFTLTGSLLFVKWLRYNDITMLIISVSVIFPIVFFSWNILEDTAFHNKWIELIKPLESRKALYGSGNR
jgi:hypothetical protein